MKLLNIIPILLLSVLATGCIGDDYSDCPAGDCTLYFEYPVFPERIGKVNVGIFDAGGLFVTAKQVDKHELLAFQGVRFTLGSGNYTAVCWGNAFDNTQIDGFAQGLSLAGGQAYHPCVHTSDSILSADSLYYGRQRFAVQETIAATDTIYFAPAYIGLEVEVKGLSGMGTTIHPFVRINSLLSVYDFDMTPGGSYGSYYPPMAIDAPNKTARTRCDVFRFEDDTIITIDVVEDSATNKTLWTVNLRQFMLKHGITVTPGQEVVIPIRIAFMDGTVNVSLIGWDGTPVDPDL